MVAPEAGWQAAGPDRFRPVLAFMGIQPDDHLLEIGCGNGVSIAFVCAQLDKGTITAIDRSEKMVARASARNQAHINLGKVHIVTSTLANAPLSGRFDKIFAVNVNVFWMRPQRELEIVRQLLEPDGSLFLFYQPPAGSDVSALREKLARNLEDASFAIVNTATHETQAIVTSCTQAKPYESQRLRRL